MKIKRGEIWLVNLDPTIGHEINKSRPSVIIQNDVGNEFSPITIIAPVSSQNIDNVYPIEVLIRKEESGIDKDSKILLNHIRAVDKQRLIKKLGKINEESILKINDAIKISLGLPSMN